MNAAIVGPWLLGGGALVASAITTINGLRDRGRTVEQAQSTIKLTDEQLKDVKQQASSSYTEERIAIETWWQKQFELVKAQNAQQQQQLDIEKKYRGRLIEHARNHEPWDELALLRLRQNGVTDMPRPPRLITVDIEDEESSGPMRRVAPQDN